MPLLMTSKPPTAPPTSSSSPSPTGWRPPQSPLPVTLLQPSTPQQPLPLPLYFSKTLFQCLCYLWDFRTHVMPSREARRCHRGHPQAQFRPGIHQHASGFDD
ncbi:hypothetical protein Fmac_013622 [Flemingia macrophylla]|uniref:Uncharacterized protein n=1 Tax=Flemingia macrophylla TaxID=520843 RepID=A0ABD1MTM9_9FABA